MWRLVIVVGDRDITADYQVIINLDTPPQLFLHSKHSLIFHFGELCITAAGSRAQPVFSVHHCCQMCHSFRSIHRT